MKFKVSINHATSIDEVKEYWSQDDYIQLLDKFNYPNAEKADVDTLRELLFMAISDFEPNEAAAIVLEYKLSNTLSDNQIQQISNDMLLDKISEEYPDISLHATLFHINQLLYKAFNGKFPTTKATLLECSITAVEPGTELDYSKEKILKILSPGLSDSTLIKRLFGEPMAGNVAFPEAESILWEVKTEDQINFKILTSNYWLSKEDIAADEFESVYLEVEQAL